MVGFSGRSLCSWTSLTSDEVSPRLILLQSPSRPPSHSEGRWFQPGWQTNLQCLKQGQQRDTVLDQAQETDIQDRDEAAKREFLCCVDCQYPITWQSERISINEKHQHVFANPHGYIYQIGCFARAPGCLAIGEETSHFSWFPGYAWQIALCGQCLTLLGWAFSSREQQFFGLILDKLAQYK